MAESQLNDLILQKLEEYGDSVIDGKPKRKKQKHVKDARDDSGGARSGLETGIHQPSELSQRQKKKLKRKKKKEELEEEEEEHTDDEKTLSGHERRLKEMSEQLGLAEFKREMESKMKEEMKRKKNDSEPEVVVFTSYKSKKQKKTDSPKVGDKTPSVPAPDFDMRRARFDVQKFGIKGFQGNKKDEAMTALLIKLGAKPPKNKYVNYKEYQEMRKQELQEEKQKREVDRRLGHRFPKANRDKKRSRDRNDVGVLDGQVGKWKSGVQIITKDDLKGFKKSMLK